MLNKALRQYYHYIKTKKIVLVFLEDRFLDQAIQTVNTIYHGRIRILEVYDCLDMYEKYKNQISILFVDNEEIMNNITVLIEESSISKNKPSANVSNVHIAFLMDVFNEPEKFLFEMDEFIPEGYELSERVYFEPKNYYLLLFGKNKMNQTSHKIAIFPGNVGYGDIIMLLPLLTYFISNSKFDIEMLHIRDNTYDICSRFLKGCKNIKVEPTGLSALIIDSYKKKSEYRELYNLTYEYREHKYRRTDCHYIEQVKTNLHINKTIDDLLKSFELDVPDLTDGDRDFILDMKKRHKYVITSQFYTYTDSRRCWPEKYVAEFIKLCRLHNIGVIRLEPGPYELNGVYDFSKYSVSSVFSIMKLVDLHVGIDSCFGHMAAIIGKPSLTIWLQTTPLVNYDLLYSSRPLRKNYSIFAENNSQNFKEIPPDLVFNKVLDILNGEILLADQFLSYQDSMNYIDCCVL